MWGVVQPQETQTQPRPAVMRLHLHLACGGRLGRRASVQSGSWLVSVEVPPVSASGAQQNCNFSRRGACSHATAHKTCQRTGRQCFMASSPEVHQWTPPPCALAPLRPRHNALLLGQSAYSFTVPWHGQLCPAPHCPHSLLKYALLCLRVLQQQIPTGFDCLACCYFPHKLDDI